MGGDRRHGDDEAEGRVHRRAQTVGGGIKPCQWLRDAAPPVSIGQSPLPWSRVARLYLPADLIFLRQCDLRHPSRESGPSPPPETTVERRLGGRHLPGGANALRATEAKTSGQVNHAIV